jgi:hypothetical protein
MWKNISSGFLTKWQTILEAGITLRHQLPNAIIPKRMQCFLA